MMQTLLSAHHQHRWSPVSILPSGTEHAALFGNSTLQSPIYLVWDCAMGW